MPRASPESAQSYVPGATAAHTAASEQQVGQLPIAGISDPAYRYLPGTVADGRVRGQTYMASMHGETQTLS